MRILFVRESTVLFPGPGDEEPNEGKQRCYNCDKFSVGDIECAPHHVTCREDDDPGDVDADEYGLHTSVAANDVGELNDPRQRDKAETSKH